VERAARESNRANSKAISRHLRNIPVIPALEYAGSSMCVTHVTEPERVTSAGPFGQLLSADSACARVPMSLRHCAILPFPGDARYAQRGTKAFRVGNRPETDVAASAFLRSR
jgi:hypothetical protein